MTIITQDGRTLDINRKYHLFICASIHGGGKLSGKKCKLSVTTFNKVFRTYSDGTTYETGDGVVERYGTVGEFDTVTCLHKASDALQKAWDNQATQFIVPFDTGEIDAKEAFDNFCEEHGLTCVSINELGYNACDTYINAHIWRTTNDFERRNILVADIDDDYNPDTFGGVYAKSLAKWRALQVSPSNNTPTVSSDNNAALPA